MKGMAIIRGVCAHYRIPLATFLGPRRAGYLNQARLIAMRQMLAAGIHQAAIARLMGRDHSTIFYWLNHEEVSVRRRAYYAARYQAKYGKSRNRLPRKASAEQRAELLRLHKAGMIAERDALQKHIGVKRNYTTDILYRERRLARQLSAKVGPIVPVGPATIRWTQPEARL
jgi:transposase